MSFKVTAAARYDSLDLLVQALGEIGFEVHNREWFNSYDSRSNPCCRAIVAKGMKAGECYEGGIIQAANGDYAISYDPYRADYLRPLGSALLPAHYTAALMESIYNVPAAITAEGDSYRVEVSL